jgi:hypothetical protein
MQAMANGYTRFARQRFFDHRVFRTATILNARLLSMRIARPNDKDKRPRMRAFPVASEGSAETDAQ